MDKTKDPSEMTVKEFMEWYVSENEGNALLPADFDKALDRLEGYALAKREDPEGYILASAVTCLRTARNFLEVVRRYTNWKYRH